MTMSAGDARRGRRDNGLVAADYAAAGDVDPRVGEHLLDVLALDGIAAYLRPSTDLHPVTRSSVLPNRPTDRLYVDRAHLAVAHGYLARLAADAAADLPPAPAASAGARPPTSAGPADHHPASNPASRDTTDEAWAQIVAGYDDVVDPPHRSWPAVEDLDDVSADDAGDEVIEERGSGMAAGELARRPETTAPIVEASLLEGLDTFGADLPDADEEGYTPPPPPPVPRPSLPTALALAGIIGGLIVFLKPELMPFQENVAMLLGFSAVVAGFGTLVWRLRPGDDEDDDSTPDDGARV